MSAIKALDQLLQSMAPVLTNKEYVFCTVKSDLASCVSYQPIASFIEDEGLTLVLEKQTAIKAGLNFEGVFKKITLTVHSSLEAVGLTAAIATKLAERDISANVIAAYYHDHIFVPANKADLALNALKTFSD
ncbi:ACT domain-containing protein [Catenovulum sp. SM1970]|uniref:ACT domain-containing protein n=1 Tax=Marinifaba aquimaris TaxID=2741323 RepID=UPI0015729797|nr:ACT domain-containing protein [Marinifaba aquimaris]NTS77147.1 ACT domain-containing protein [Marinifaba aquimaris]